MHVVYEDISQREIRLSVILSCLLVILKYSFSRTEIFSAKYSCKFSVSLAMTDHHPTYYNIYRDIEWRARCVLVLCKHKTGP